MSGLPLGWRLRALAASLAMPPLLAVVSPDRLLPRRRRAAAPPGPPDAADLAAWVDGLLRRLPPPWRYTCLRRGVVLCRLLRRAGHPVTLAIGVRREGGELAAHAWLVRDGRPWLEPAEHAPDRYREIARFPEGEGG